MIGKFITIQELKFLQNTLVNITDVLKEIDVELDTPEEVLEDIFIGKELITKLLLSKEAPLTVGALV